MERVVKKYLQLGINVRILNQTFTALSWDPGKQNQTLLARGLDFSKAIEIFSQLHFTREDVRKNYGERRFVTFGQLDHRLVVLVWTERFPAIHIISMRRANSRERKAYQVLHH